jgi:hypothetical protein
LLDFVREPKTSRCYLHNISQIITAEIHYSQGYHSLFWRVWKFQYLSCWFCYCSQENMIIYSVSWLPGTLLKTGRLWLHIASYLPTRLIFFPPLAWFLSTKYSNLLSEGAGPDGSSSSSLLPPWSFGKITAVPSHKENSHLR